MLDRHDNEFGLFATKGFGDAAVGLGFVVFESMDVGMRFDFI